MTRAMRVQAGFTLVELSVVLTIIAVIIGSALTMGSSTIDQAREAQTRNKIKVIQQTFLIYRQVTNRLPCPASLTIKDPKFDNTTISTFGYELGTPGDGNCTGATALSATVFGGGVPVTTLGLPNDFTYDGWGRRFLYAVDKNATFNDAFITVGKMSSSDGGTITVNAGTGISISSAFVYVLVSHGSNGHGAYLADGSRRNAGSVNQDEQDNCNCTNTGVAGTVDAVFEQKDKTEDSTNPYNNFDDIVVSWRRKHLRAFDE